MNIERIERFWAKVDKTGDCWLWTASTDGMGYGLFGTGPSRSERAHRVSYRLAFGEIAPDLCVLHRCDNPSCVRPEHLFLGTRADNMRDRQQKGRQAHGERHSRAKLTETAVREIRELRARGEQLRAIAEKFSIAPETVSAIAHRRTWRHV